MDDRMLHEATGCVCLWPEFGQERSSPQQVPVEEGLKRKKTKRPFPKRKTPPTVQRIFQSLAHEVKSNTAYFKAS